MGIMRRMGRNCLIAALAGLLLGPVCAVAAPSPWEQPAANLAGKIAGLLGPGQARLSIRNLSSISTNDIPIIRKLLVQDLKARGITQAGPDSANAVRVTLSENAQERLWVAEAMEGDDTRVAIVELGPAPAEAVTAPGALLLSNRQILISQEPIVALLQAPTALVALEPEQIVLYLPVGGGWHEQQRAAVDADRRLARDTRGVLAPDAGGAGFVAWLPGAQCTGSIAPPSPPAQWTIRCRASDDPWPVAQPPARPVLSSSGPLPAPQTDSAPAIRAFYNSSRNYFTGVLVPSLGLDLPPFYSLARIPRAGDPAAVLIGGIDGKVELAQNAALHPLTGTRDWGSDFAALQSGCGAGTQVIVSGSGGAPSDSLRAYELTALEAVPVSQPLPVAGTVTALSTAPDQRSVLAVVRNANQYEVDRVSALCN